MANRTRSSFSKSQRSGDSVSKSPPSKNLAHVPCKFFKQGACQAGNACPFSHQLDSSAEAAPCKYFQKGNCKFGAKCALAHILPDGRRVNPKTLAQVYQNHNVVGNGGNSNGNGTANVTIENNHSEVISTRSQSSSTSPSSAVPVQIVNNSGTSDANANGNGVNGFFATRTLSVSHSLSPTTHNVTPNFPLLSTVSTSPTSSFTGSASRVGSLPTSSFISTEQQQQSHTPTVNPQRSYSTSIWSTQSVDVVGGAGISTSSSSSYQHGMYYRSVSHSSAIRPSYQYTPHTPHLNENAIMDDDDEEDEPEEMFEEDFVPSSLSDLLTPQELQRRGSRSSISRPSMSAGFLHQWKHGVVYENGEAVEDDEEEEEEEIGGAIAEESEMQFKMDDEEEFLGGNAHAVEVSMDGLRI